jgi:hypothetical protein
MKYLSLFGAIMAGGLFGAHVAEGSDGLAIMFITLTALNIFLYAINDK